MDSTQKHTCIEVEEKQFEKKKKFHEKSSFLKKHKKSTFG